MAVGTEAVYAAGEELHGWKAVMCRACKALGFTGGLVVCGMQFAALVTVIGLVAWLIVF